MPANGRRGKITDPIPHVFGKRVRNLSWTPKSAQAVGTERPGQLRKSLGQFFAGSVRLPRAVWLLVIGRSINHVGAFTLSFLAVALTQEFGASISSAGLLVALFGAATLPSRLVAGGSPIGSAIAPPP